MCSYSSCHQDKLDARHLQPLQSSKESPQQSHQVLVGPGQEFGLGTLSLDDHGLFTAFSLYGVSQRDPQEQCYLDLVGLPGEDGGPQLLAVPQALQDAVQEAVVFPGVVLQARRCDVGHRQLHAATAAIVGMRTRPLCCGHGLILHGGLH